MLRAMAVASILFVSQGAFAQPAATPGPAFEVASIKQNKSGDSPMMVRPSPGGRFTVTNAPLQFVITMAYRIKDSQLSGAPPWFMTEPYDIQARAEGNPSFDTMLPMIQKLLEDRLQLKFHRDTKDIPVYALLVAKPGKLHQAEGECGPPPSGPPPALEPGKLPTLPCGLFLMFPGHLSAQKVPLGRLVDTLSVLTSRIVLDKTNLAGKYDINLDYTPEPGQFQASPLGAPPGLLQLPPADPNGPSLFTALQEQLGLKLESQKSPVEIMVIDHAERPSEN
jgi:uncharacterized protein (TIGR03435 family)